jgi:hypothetical protein
MKHQSAEYHISITGITYLVMEELEPVDIIDLVYSAAA